MEWCEGSGTKAGLSVCFCFLTVWFWVRKALIRRGKKKPTICRVGFPPRRRGLPSPGPAAARVARPGPAGAQHNGRHLTERGAAGSGRPAGSGHCERCGRRAGPRGRRGRRVGARAAGGLGGAPRRRPTSRRPRQHPVCSGRGSRGRQHPRVSPEPPGRAAAALYSAAARGRAKHAVSRLPPP